MKKNLLKLVLLIIPLFYIAEVYAAGATMSVSSSANQVIVGKEVTITVTISSSVALGSWEYTLNYDNSVFKLVRSDVDLQYASYANNAKTKSVSYRYVFKALKSSNSKFYVDSSMAVAWDESILNVTNGARAVKTLTYSEYQATLSKNNNLSKLYVDGYELSPAFNKDILEYNVQVNEDETSVKIGAIVEDKTASVSGIGTHEVSAGNNMFDIVVIAQNGSEKTYKINVEVIDKNPINIEVNGINYTLVKLASNLIKPNSYTETTIVINEIEIPAFYSEITDFTLVGLKDATGNVSLFIYENDKYTKYHELNFGNITLYPLSMQREIKEYEKHNIQIQQTDIEVLSLENDSRFKLVYGLNVETKEEGLYLYDSKDNTIVKYDEEYTNILKEQNKLLIYSTGAFGICTLLALIGIIALSSKNKKIKKQKKKALKSKKENQKIEITDKTSEFDNNVIVEKKVNQKHKK